MFDLRDDVCCFQRPADHALNSAACSRDICRSRGRSLRPHCRKARSRHAGGLLMACGEQPDPPLLYPISRQLTPRLPSRRTSTKRAVERARRADAVHISSLEDLPGSCAPTARPTDGDPRVPSAYRRRFPSVSCSPVAGSGPVQPRPSCARCDGLTSVVVTRCEGVPSSRSGPARHVVGLAPTARR